MHLTLLLQMAVDAFGDRVVVGRRDDGITAAGLRERSEAGAQLLREQGADALIYLAVNGPAFPVAMFAAATAGVPLVPLNYRLGTEQVASLLAKHPGAVVIGAGDMDPRLVHGTSRWLTPDEWLRATTTPAGQDAAAAVDEDVPAVIIYTSGTTSEPKGVLLRHHNLMSYIFNTVEFASALPDDAALVSVPPYHIAAVANVISNLYAGRRCLVLERFEPGEWLDTVRREGVTNALVVPTMLARLVDADADKELPSLRTLAYGGAPMPSSVLRRALEQWPDIDFVNAYGLTETSSTIAVLGPEDHRAAFESDEPHVQQRLSSVGRVLPTVDLEIRDAQGEPVAPGVSGRIFVRGEQVSADYAGLGPALDERGFFDTRDEGYVDTDGYLYIGGRSDDTIIRGAENIAPAEIEDVLLRHPAVTDAAVVGVPDEEWGQRVEAVVVTSGSTPPDPEELRTHVRGILRGSKTPDRILIWPELPRTETGKLVRRNIVGELAGNGADST